MNQISWIITLTCLLACFPFSPASSSGKANKRQVSHKEGKTSLTIEFKLTDAMRISVVSDLFVSETASSNTKQLLNKGSFTA